MNIFAIAWFRDYGGERCQHLSGVALDRVVTQQVLAALQPAALELSLQAATQLEQERDQLNQIWQQRLERAAFEAERAGRHYRLVEGRKSPRGAAISTRMGSKAGRAATVAGRLSAFLCPTTTTIITSPTSCH